MAKKYRGGVETYPVRREERNIKRKGGRGEKNLRMFEKVIENNILCLLTNITHPLNKVIPFGCLPEIEDKTLLMKTPNTSDTEFGKLIWI